MGLDELNTSKQAKIQKILPNCNNKDDSSFQQRLYDMGIIPGEKIKMLIKTPLGGPLLVRVMGSNLCLRRDLANTIRLEGV